MAHPRATLQTFKTKAFARFARREGLGDTALCEAVERAEKGLVDADLGGGVIKQRVKEAGSARSAVPHGRTRVLRVWVRKSDRENLRPDELAAFRLLADEALDPAGLAAVRSVGAIIEVRCNGQTVQE